MINKNKKMLAFCVSSGKGGVGKTLTTINLAINASISGYKVLILDGDLGLANIDVVLGLRSKNNIRDVLDGKAELKDIIISGPNNIKIIPSGSGISSLTTLSYLQKQVLFDQIANLDTDIDILLIDTGAGIADNVIHFNLVSDRRIIVTTPEPHALTDAYALIKVLSETRGIKDFNIVINQTKSKNEGRVIFDRLHSVTNKFLDVDLNYIGNVPFDSSISNALMSQNSESITSKNTISGQAWNNVFNNFMNIVENSGRSLDNMADFWERLLKVDDKEHEELYSFNPKKIKSINTNI